jgi:hypothetical protein
VRIENREGKSQEEENRGQPAGNFGEDVGRLGAENILGDAAAKGCAEAFALWALHQDDEHHERGVKDVNAKENVDRQVHWDGQYDKQMTNVECRNATDASVS